MGLLVNPLFGTFSQKRLGPGKLKEALFGNLARGGELEALPVGDLIVIAGQEHRESGIALTPEAAPELDHGRLRSIVPSTRSLGGS